MKSFKWILGLVFGLFMVIAVNAQYTLTGPTSAITGETHTYTVNGSDIAYINWYAGNGETISNQTSNSADYTFNNSGQTLVSAQVGDEFNNTYNLKKSVSVCDPLSAGSISGSQSICYSGNPSTLGNSASASGGDGTYAYQWQYSANGSSGWTNISGATGTTYDPPGGLTASRWYRRRAISCSQTKYTGSRKVTVYSQLSAGTLIGTQNVCYNGNPVKIKNLTLPNGGDGSYSYQWQYSTNGSSGWTNISGATSLEYDPPSGLTVDRWYRRRVQSCGETKYTSSHKADVYPSLTAGSINGTQTICYGGDPSTLGNSGLPSGGNGSYTYQWQYSANGSSGWTNISGATGSTYNPPSGLTADRWYRRRVISCSQTKYTGSIKVTVRPALVAGSINGTQTICYSGDPSTLGNSSSASGGNGSYTYQWQYSTNGSSGWTNISGATGTTYNPPSGLTADRWYRRRAISCGQTKYTGTIKVTVRPNLVAGAINGTDTICYGGDPSTLGSSSSASGGDGSYTYQWQYSANGSSSWANISGATASTYNPPSGLTVDRWYRRRVQSCSQTKYTSNVKITVRPDLAAGSINGTQSICQGGDPSNLGSSTSPSGGDGSYGYQWQYSDNGSSGWTNISGATSSTYNPPSGLSSDRWYRRGVVSCGQTKYTTSVKVTVTAPPIWYADVDGDGFGDPQSTTASCTQPGGYVGNSADHDDTTVMITNIAPQTFYKDADGDGFGDSSKTAYASFAPMGYADNNADQCPNSPGANNGCGYSAPSLSDENYVHTRTYQVPLTDPAQIKDDRDVMETVAYFDGLGRPMQQVGLKASGTGTFSGNIRDNVAEWAMDWQEGSGSTAFYNQNGATSENDRQYGPDPFGQTSLIWVCGNDPSSGPDGGWNTDYFNVDITVAYRYSVWVKRTHSQDGKTYHGTQNVDNLSGGANGNPYFWSGDLPQLEQWYLLVGVVHPYNYAGGDTGVSGVYDLQGNKVLDGTEFKWGSGTTTSRFRSYLFYSTDVNVRQYFYGPVLQKMDGTENPLSELILGQVHRDLVTHIGYDDYGRQAREYLPYVPMDGAIGTYRSSAEADTDAYYVANYASEMGTTPNPYTQKEFEASPLNRVLKQAAPGEDWQLGNDHEIEFEYSTNITNEVRLFSVTTSYTNNIYEPSLVDGSGNTYYNVGELYKNITKDENHDGTSSKLHTTEEFTDKQGRVVLKRTYALISNVETAHDTYYVYDDFGNLTYVLPPKMNASSASLLSIQSQLDDLGYQYVYDHKNRLVEKKIPGKGWEYIVYNKMNQPIMTQDALLNGQGKWLFTRYDALGRLAFTGMVTGGSRQAEQTAADNASVQWTEQSGSATTVDGVSLYYNGNGYPTLGSVTELHTINYYDGYNATRDGIAKPVGQVLGQDQATDVTGLPTASKVRILDNAQWITTLTVYDKKGRAIWVESDNPYLGTTDIVKTALDFAGETKQQQSEHTKSGNSTITTTETFEYDQTGRLVLQEQTLDGKTETLFLNRYDDLGQLVTKDVGNTLGNPLQTVDYDYNIRGWLKEINDPSSLGGDLFAFGINYNTADHGGTPLYNGNISETEWSTSNTDSSLKWYRYEYDALNRIVGAKDNTGYFNVGTYDGSGNLIDPITYDKNGNIETLVRMGHITADPSITDPTDYGTMDNLIYSYSGNQLTIVDDRATTDQFGFKDDIVGSIADDSVDYQYDANGNMTMDLNKGIQANDITYNHLNLPTNIVTSSGNISYVYDAMGTKLEKSAGGSVTQYAGNYIYTGALGSESLQFFSQPEGYVTPNGQGSYDYVYQYKDHLGNIRLSYIDPTGNYEQILKSDFENGFDGWMQNGSVNYSIESGRIKANVNSAYEGIKYELDGVTTVAGETLTVKLDFEKGNTQSSVRLYLPEYDSSGTLVRYNVASGNMTTGYHEYTLTMMDSGNRIGYIRIDKDNTNTGTETYFYVDDVILVRNDLQIVEENNYYPFGLKHKGYNNVTSSFGNSVAQKWKYNGKELEESLDLNLYEMDMRHYDPAMARWTSIDPVIHHSMSPYNSFDNNPVFWADPSGANSIQEIINAQFANSGSGSTTYTNNGDGSFSQTARDENPEDGGPKDDITVNSEGIVTNVVANGEPNRFFDEQGNELFFNDPNNVDASKLSPGAFSVGDRLFYSIDSKKLNGFLSIGGLEPLGFNLMIGSSELSGFLADKTLAYWFARLKSQAGSKSDFTFSVLAKNFAFRKIKQSGTYTGYDETSAFFKFGSGTIMYNWFDAGNFMWGAWMNLNKFSYGEARFGSQYNENFNDTSADQRAIKNGFYLNNK